MYYGTKPLASVRPEIWELVPGDSNNTEFLEVFNSAIKIGTKKCPWTLFRHTFTKRAKCKMSN